MVKLKRAIVTQCASIVVIVVSLIFSANALANDLEAVQVYSQDELIKLINENKHLQRVKDDRCQIIEDIEARAEVMRIPSFQFLWGDMQAWGVCVSKDTSSGIHYMRQAANQGLPAALEQLGRYHKEGKFVRQSHDKAIVYLREASSLGNLKAQLQLAELFIAGYGSPYDYEDIYRWLYSGVSQSNAQYRQIGNYLTELERLMSPQAVKNAQNTGVN